MKKNINTVIASATKQPACRQARSDRFLRLRLGMMALFFLLLSSYSLAQDSTKITDMPALTAPDGTEVFYVAENDSDKQITGSTMAAAARDTIEANDYTISGDWDFQKNLTTADLDTGSVSTLEISDGAVTIDKADTTFFHYLLKKAGGVNTLRSASVGDWIAHRSGSIAYNADHFEITTGNNIYSGTHLTKLTTGEKYYAIFQMKYISGTPGYVISFGTGASVGVDAVEITPDGTLTTYQGIFTASNSDFVITQKLNLASNVYQVGGVMVVEYSALDKYLDSLNTAAHTSLDSIEILRIKDLNIEDGYIRDNNSDMSSSNDWTAAGNGPALTPDFATVPGKMVMTLDSSGTNQGLLYVIPTEALGKKLFVRLKVRLRSGAGTQIQVGYFYPSATERDDNFFIEPDSVERVYTGIIDSVTVTNFALGVIDSWNDGLSSYEIDDVHAFYMNDYYNFVKTSLDSIPDHKKVDWSMKLDEFLKTYDKDNPFTQKLTVLGWGGDSVIDFDNATSNTYEGDHNRPYRFRTATFARQFLEQLKLDTAKYQIPTYEQADTNGGDGNWTKSGNWSRSKDRRSKRNITNVAGYGDDYWFQYSNTQDDYAELIVPDSNDTFALLHTASDDCSNDIEITISNPNVDGGAYHTPAELRASYSVDIVDEYGNDLADSLDDDFSSADVPSDYTNSKTTGQIHQKITVISGLPSGANTIRFTIKTGEYFELWGGFYWDGNAIHLARYGHGSHDLSMLYGYMYEEIYSGKCNFLILQDCAINNHIHHSSTMPGITFQGTVGFSKTDVTNVLNVFLGGLKTLNVSTVMIGNYVDGLDRLDSNSTVTNYYYTRLQSDVTGVADFRELTEGAYDACAINEVGFIDLGGYFNDLARRYGNSYVYVEACDRTATTVSDYPDPYNSADGYINEKDIRNGVFYRRWLISDGAHLSQYGHNEVFNLLKMHLLD